MYLFTGFFSFYVLKRKEGGPPCYKLIQSVIFGHIRNGQTPSGWLLRLTLKKIYIRNMRVVCVCVIFLSFPRAVCLPIWLGELCIVVIIIRQISAGIFWKKKAFFFFAVCLRLVSTPSIRRGSKWHRCHFPTGPNSLAPQYIYIFIFLNSCEGKKRKRFKYVSCCKLLYFFFNTLLRV